MIHARVIVVVLLMACSTSVWADSPATQPGSDKPNATRDRILYVPRRGAPVERVGGGVRAVSVDEKIPSVAVFAPLETGLTLKTQPTLYWFLSLETKQPAELTIQRADDDKPLFTKTLTGETAGVHALDLKAANVTLETGVEYEWSVAVVLDPKKRAGDVSATGKIKRIDGDKEMVQSLSAATGFKQIEIAAANGLWYDAIGPLSQNIEQNPGDSALRRLRADLLRQVKIETAAAADEALVAGKKP